MDIECAVCLQSSIHPVKLPCRHIFCFLCVKGVTIQSRRCPICRREIPSNYLEHPNLVEVSDVEPDVNSVSEREEDQEATGGQEENSEAIAEDDHKWFYQGRNGWWEYDKRTAQELEHYHKKGDKSCELLIAGFLYSIDFEQMLQCRRNEPHRRRQIKRDLATNVADKKGVAGIRTNVSNPNSVDAVDTLVDQVSSILLADDQAGNVDAVNPSASAAEDENESQN